MRTIASLFVITCFYSSLRAAEEIRYPSPDGTLALRIGGPNESGYSEVGIIESSTHKVVLNLGSLGHPNEETAKLVWSANSQRVAFFEPTKRGGLTHVFFRNNASFDEIELPTLPEPKTTKKVPPNASDKTVTALVEPVYWLKSGALVLYHEVEGDYSGRGALEITIGFDQNLKPSVAKSRKVSPR